MPGTNGLQFLKIIKERDKSIPFILLTGKGKEEIVIDALNLGADRYIQKGVDTESMFAEIIDSVNKLVLNKMKINGYIKTISQTESDLNNIFDSTDTIVITVSLDNTVTRLNKIVFCN